MSYPCCYFLGSGGMQLKFARVGPRVTVDVGCRTLSKLLAPYNVQLGDVVLVCMHMQSFPIRVPEYWCSELSQFSIVNVMYK